MALRSVVRLVLLNLGIRPVYEDSKSSADPDLGARASIGSALRRWPVCTVIVYVFPVYLRTFSGIALDSQRTLIGLFLDRTGLSPDFLRTRTGLFMILLGFHAEFRVWRLKNRAGALLIRFSLTPSAIFLRSELQPWISSLLSSEDTK